MLTMYLEAAMARAVYEYLENDGIYYGEIPELQGVLAIGEDAASCAEALRDMLEEWVVLRLRANHALPPLDGVVLEPALAS